jgi:toluene monooxygenase electron transfer component
MTNYEPGTTSLDFVIKRKPGGILSEILFDGEDLSSKKINIFGPLGKAYYETHNPNDLICIAGGTGVAGMLSILKSFVANNENSGKNAQLFFGVRKNQDLFFGNELHNLVAQGKGAINVYVAISDDDVDKNLKEKFPLLSFEKGLVHEVALQKLKNSELLSSVAYLAGPPPLVNACIKMFLLEFKFKSNRIFFDKFS